MHDETRTHGLPQERSTGIRSVRAYMAMVGAATLSALVLHMVRSTTAANDPEPMVQYLTLPVDRQAPSIDTSLQPVGT